jgi:hypothetical protein
MKLSHLLFNKDTILDGENIEFSVAVSKKYGIPLYGIFVKIRDTEDNSISEEPIMFFPLYSFKGNLVGVLKDEFVDRRELLRRATIKTDNSNHGTLLLRKSNLKEIELFFSISDGEVNRILNGLPSRIEDIYSERSGNGNFLNKNLYRMESL